MGDSMTTRQFSDWGKWDLHIHSPASVVQSYGADDPSTWEKFVSDLERLPSEFKVLGINDYIFIDGYEKLRAYKKAGRLQNIELILPVIELRIDKFGGVVKREKSGDERSNLSRINLHIIFDALEPELIRQQFLSALTHHYQLIPERRDLGWKAVITRESLIDLGSKVIDSVPADKRADFGSPIEEGFNNLNVSLDRVKEAIDNHHLNGRYLLAVGKAEWADIKWNDNTIAEKKHIINSVDLVFSASTDASAYAKAKLKLQQEGVNRKLLDCSD